MRFRSVLATLLLPGAVLLTGVPCLAQSGVTGARAISTGNPKRDALARLLRPITINFEGQRLEDIVTFLAEFSGAELEPLWIDDEHTEGLDKDQLITMKADNITVLTLLERILDKAAATGIASAGGNSWQLTDWGTVQIGPKVRLNLIKRVEIYAIDDLLFIVPDYEDAPDFDLQSVLQSSQGGGGQSPFRENQQGRDDEDSIPRDERARDIIDLVQQLVETEQWTDNGGDGASARYFQGSIIVNGPDYIHRQINGYPFWPSRLQSARNVDGRRYVTLSTDTAISNLEGFGEAPVTAVVGGQLVSSDPGGGG